MIREPVVGTVKWQPGCTTVDSAPAITVRMMSGWCHLTVLRDKGQAERRGQDARKGTGWAKGTGYTFGVIHGEEK